MSTVVDLGKQLYEARIESGLTQEALAEKAGVSRRWLIELEKGHYNAQLHKVLAVAAALGYDLTVVPAVVGPVDQELEDFVSGFVS